MRTVIALAVTLLAWPASATDYIIRAASQAAMVQGLYAMGVAPAVPDPKNPNGKPIAPTAFTSPYLQSSDANGNSWFVVHASGGGGQVMVPQRSPAGYTAPIAQPVATSGIISKGLAVIGLAPAAPATPAPTPLGAVVTKTVNGLPQPVLQPADANFYAYMRWNGPSAPVFPSGIVVIDPATLPADFMAGMTVVN